jgi:hypothetical protein
VHRLIDSVGGLALVEHIYKGGSRKMREMRKNGFLRVNIVMCERAGRCLFGWPFLNRLLGELVNGFLVLDSSVRYLDRPWIRSNLSTITAFMFRIFNGVFQLNEKTIKNKKEEPPPPYTV